MALAAWARWDAVWIKWGFRDRASHPTVCSSVAEPVERPCVVAGSNPLSLLQAALQSSRESGGAGIADVALLLERCGESLGAMFPEAALRQYREHAGGGGGCTFGSDPALSCCAVEHTLLRMLTACAPELCGVWYLESM